MSILQGDAVALLREMPAGYVRCCVTSPPYWGLRDYGVEGQLGLERTPEEYVARMVDVFREVRRVLADDGTLWLNLGDSYNAYNGNAGPSSGLSAGSAADTERPKLASGYGLSTRSLKPKDLVGIPWRVAFALQADGWWLRSDIIWHKPNPMPESVTDRPTKAHEYVFLLTKSAKYYYDAKAIVEPQSPASLADHLRRKPSSRSNGAAPDRGTGDSGLRMNGVMTSGFRNRRTVWTITPKPFKGAHFAVMPEALVEPCVLAGSAVGDTVLDPFAGSGTVGVVAKRHGRDFVGCELNPEYVTMAGRRIESFCGTMDVVEVG
jgi:DNA modification methylase